MEIRYLKPRKALNKAFLKVKPNRTVIESFKINLIQLLDRINDVESEEFHKNLVIDFLKKTYYDLNYFVNTKDRNDLVIHNGDKATSTVGVIVEAKKPTNKAEMLTKDKINVKAFHELVLYYLRERITQKNFEIKYLIATNINEWFIFDAHSFEKHFAQNIELVRKFVDFENGSSGGKTTDFFYKQIAESYIANLNHDIEFTWFDIREYEKPLRNNDPKDDTKLISLFKLFSPQHLLKLPFANDSNSLDKRFYGELLHIIGLTETKNGSKKLIERNKEGERNTGSFLENAIIQLDSHDKITRLEKPGQFGANFQERLFNVGLELSITWINRVLFLKLLEAQLITYHKGDKSYEFLNFDKIKDYDDLNSLFFQVLARKQNERSEDIKALFAKVPYLNSSLFEPTEIEHVTLFISNLRNDKTIPIYSSTVIKDDKGKKRTGAINPLEYLFEFLNAYDFASEGNEEIQEDNKTLINASVLGLIFEKINGYKDGSFFTPGFITMYMCRETIRKAVIQKFNEAKSWNCSDMDSLYDKIEDRNEANKIINDLKICDPAVGSGHFLVSVLNEMIAIKSDLKILEDRDGRRLKEYHFEVVNDEMIVTDEDGELFEYNPTNKESQRIQETLFHEKQTIIENCLFGVDINPNSVKICRLRLWIELLKNAYYKNETELETLPNIDINIKCGNSLISRYALDADIKKALRKSKWTIDSYRLAVMTYRNARSKDEKRAMEKLISQIKNDFESEIAANDKRFLKLNKLKGELYLHSNQQGLFELGKTEKKVFNKKTELLTAELRKLETELEEIANNRIYENAFEWRFEFPEVLNNDGDFVGFDVVIGNPPYGVNLNKENAAPFIERYVTFNLRGESYVLFIEKSNQLLKPYGNLGLIIPDTLLNLGFTSDLRSYLLEKTKLEEVVLLPSSVFNDATVDTILLFFKKDQDSLSNEYHVRVKTFSKKEKEVDLYNSPNNFDLSISFWSADFGFNVQSNQKELALINMIDNRFPHLDSYVDIFSGIKAYEVGKGLPQQTNEIRDTKPFTSIVQRNDRWKPYFEGKDIGYYSLLWNDDNWIDYGDWLAAPREAHVFEGEKILIRKIVSSRLIASYIDYTSYCNTLLFVLKLRVGVAKQSYHSLLGILNSKFIGWYFRKKFQIANDDTFPQIMIRDILQFSIPNVCNELTEKIETLVSQILSFKQSDSQINTTTIEEKIDQLVYQLYDLTAEEITIIENGLP